MSVTIYQEADWTNLPDARIAVIGYGNIGSTVARNLRDRGHEPAVGTLADQSADQARRDGFNPISIPEACTEADLIALLVPDEVISECLKGQVLPAMPPTAALVFASGYALAFEQLTLPTQSDVVLVAPRMTGTGLRARFERNDGALAFIAIEQDASGHALAKALHFAHLIGCLRRGAIRVSAHQEALIDLLVEQAFGSYLGVALQATFGAAVALGIPPEVAVAELYMSGEMSQTFDTFSTRGFMRSLGDHGVTAPFGGFLRSLEIDARTIDDHIRAIASDIESGGFARTLTDERERGMPFSALLHDLVSGNDSISSAETNLRQALEPYPSNGAPTTSR